MKNEFGKLYRRVILRAPLVLCSGVRANMSSWLEKLNCNGDVEKQWFFKNKFINKLRYSKIALETQKANEQHYEVPTEFFTTVSNLRL